LTRICNEETSNMHTTTRVKTTLRPKFGRADLRGKLAKSARPTPQHLWVQSTSHVGQLLSYFRSKKQRENTATAPKVGINLAFSLTIFAQTAQRWIKLTNELDLGSLATYIKHPKDISMYRNIYIYKGFIG
jgi:hypothetical protein